MCDLTFAPYFDFETTTRAKGSFDPEDSEIYLIFFVIIFAFQPNFNIYRIITERRFSRLLGKLTNISYLSVKILENVDSVTAEELCDCAVNVS